MFSQSVIFLMLLFVEKLASWVFKKIVFNFVNLICVAAGFGHT